MAHKKQVISYLDHNKIPFEVFDHEPIYTIGQLDEMDYPDKDKLAKNLFLRNGSGKCHYLVVVRSDKKVDLKQLRQQIGSSRLSFASEERLMKHMGLTKGSVSPLGILNDATASIPVLMDQDLMGQEKIGLHPNINTATLWMSHENIVKAIEGHGNEVIHVLIEG